MGGMQNRYNMMETDERMILNLKWLLLTNMDTEDCVWKRLFKDLKIESLKRWSQSTGNQSTVHTLSITPLPPTRRCQNRYCDTSRSFIENNNEIVLRSLTVFARKGDLKISPPGAAWCRSLSNPCRLINKVTAEKWRGGKSAFKVTKVWINRCLYLDRTVLCAWFLKLQYSIWSIFIP